MELHDKEVFAYAQLRMQNEKRKPATSLLGAVGKKTDRSTRYVMHLADLTDLDYGWDDLC